MKTERADFSPAVREKLAQRAGYRCSYRGCAAMTVGPSAESDMAASSTGMACHIAAAAGGPGARRVVTTMTREELADISNGIWMCYKHGKLIDTDEVTYTIPMLQIWRRMAELRAKLSHEMGRAVELDVQKLHDFYLPEDQISLTALGTENTVIGDALQNACVSEIWGKDVGHAVRDVAIELVRNALMHGKASSVTLEIEPTYIAVVDDGEMFDSRNLLQNDRFSGGALALNRLSDKFKSHVFYGWSRNGTLNRNQIALLRAPEDLEKVTPCTVKVTLQDFYAGNISVTTLEGCDAIYILMPPYSAQSIALRLPTMIVDKLPDGKNYILVGEDLSDGVIETFMTMMPHGQVINF